MKRRKIMASIGIAIGVGAVACSSEPTGSNEQAIGENACGYRTVPTTQSSTGEGISIPSWTMACGGTYQDSIDGQYGYSNCANAMIWEILAVNGNGTCGGRLINTYVQPKTQPSDQTDCVNTEMKYYVYGLDTVNGNFYNYAGGQTATADTYCSWSSLFGCNCNSTVSGIDLDNFPDGLGGTVSVEGVRMVGQIYNHNQGAYETIRESIAMYDYGTCCINRPE